MPGSWRGRDCPVRGGFAHSSLEGPCLCSDHCTPEPRLSCVCFPPGLPRTPGPGTYSPERAPPPSQRRPPSFSMGARTKPRRVDATPAPNSYSLPSLLGPRVPSQASSPSFSISSWTVRGSHAEDLSRTPGPGHYASTDLGVYLSRPPAFSMLGRLKEPTRSFLTPGPGAHSPEKVTAHRPRAPSYSLGVRHSEYLMPLVLDAMLMDNTL
uniref:Outer dense fiber of sperm tails 3 like 2 n=1 Tax=Varanus komodoensis TaxID=61221 RepID=A0A8D2IXL5_VARKO